MLAEAEGDEWFSRRNPVIRGKRGDLFVIRTFAQAGKRA